MKNAKLYETHVQTTNLEKAIEFYEKLELKKAYVLHDRRAAFFFLGNAEKKEQMLGIWEVPKEKFVKSHFAFKVSLNELLQIPSFLEKKDISLVPSFGLDVSEPMVHTWMPAAAYYFQDPDGNSLEYISLIEGMSSPELGVVPLSKWNDFNKDKLFL